jgi:glycolate oxidase iron-sulfur subunit
MPAPAAPPGAPRVREGWEEVYARSLDCVHCGLCLPACPTYLETGREVSSPRGRIYLMRSAAEGRIPLAGTLAAEASLCLGCRACETACPSGVRYGRMLEEARHQLARAGARRGAARRVERAALRQLVARPPRLRLAFDLLRLAQRLGLDRLAARLLPGALADAAKLLPPVPPRSARAPLPALVPAEGTRRTRVGFLAGCVMRELFSHVNSASVRVLAMNGFEVVIPPGQGCCGALHAHAGDADFARDLARRNAEAFAGADVVISNSAGCGAAMREAGAWLPGAGDAFAASVRDVCEFLDAEGLRAPLRPVPARVCYDDPCHLLHGQKVGDAPRRLLRSIPGLELAAHDHPDACCGAAGTYNLMEPAMARAVLDRKLTALAAADPDLVATGNPGCLMQLRAGLARAGLRAQVVHPVELLLRSHEGHS